MVRHTEEITRNKRAAAQTAITAADTFRAHARMFTRGLGPDRDEAVEPTFHNLGELLASVTMLALAVELYLKTLQILLDVPVPTTHHLWRLYQHVPVELQQSIKAQYDQVNRVPTNSVDSLTLALGGGTRPADAVHPDIAPTSSPVPYDLKAVLIRSSDAFQTWRYLHEQEQAGVAFEYEFRRLNLICEIVRQHVMERLPASQP